MAKPPSVFTGAIGESANALATAKNKNKPVAKICRSRPRRTGGSMAGTARLLPSKWPAWPSNDRRFPDSATGTVYVMIRSLLSGTWRFETVGKQFGERQDWLRRTAALVRNSRRIERVSAK